MTGSAMLENKGVKRHRWKWVALLCFLPLVGAAFVYRPLSHESMRQLAYLAAERGDLPTLKRLLDNGLSPNARVQGDNAWLLKIALGERDYFKIGVPLIMTAYDSGHPTVMRYLLDRGADVNNVDKVGMTVLAVAARNNDFEVVKELIERGADPYASWKDGVLPKSTDARVQALIDHAKQLCSDRGLPCKRHRNHPSPGSN